jgi:hypothetical protein
VRPPAELVEVFDRAIAGFPNAERRLMFGCPSVFVNGNMVGGLYEGLNLRNARRFLRPAEASSRQWDA